ncbi:MAG: NADH-quinone oxidoreductase subunit A [Calditrichaceae bacterium]|nr:NADH-quinone oxidoreductase subunit A [Calditrichia bacterium]NUQ40794.1 NADH-quinone oxidoreductase subunit A [Calditrichaceae bacterium]
MLSQYLPVLIVLAFALVVAGAILFLSHVVSPRIKDAVKQQVYESGINPQMDARLRYPIRFYVVAMMFVLFDIEVIFMYPWAVVYNQFLSQGAFIFWEMVVFLGILFAGYLYLWKRGAFQWE